MASQVSAWQRVGCSVCLWSAGGEHSKAGKAELERKVMLAVPQQVSLQDEDELSAGEGGDIHAQP